jgi:hypothetical protein
LRIRGSTVYFRGLMVVSSSKLLTLSAAAQQKHTCHPAVDRSRSTMACMKKQPVLTERASQPMERHSAYQGLGVDLCSRNTLRVCRLPRHLPVACRKDSTVGDSARRSLENPVAFTVAKGLQLRGGIIGKGYLHNLLRACDVSVRVC